MLLTLASLLFTGLVQAVISPPSNLLFLHPAAWVPALAVFSRLEGRRALMAGWLVGFSANLAIFDWLPGTVSRFGDLPWAAAVVVWLLFAAATGFYSALFAWGFARVRRRSGSLWPFAIAAWFSAVEFLNPQIFGYLQGDAWYQVPHFFLATAVTGVSGISFLVMLGNAVVLQAVEYGRCRTTAARRDLLRNAAALAALLLVAGGYSTWRLGEIRRAEDSAATMRVALVQPDHTIDRRHELDGMKPSAFADDLVAMSRDAAAAAVRDGAKIDVFVWPEGALRSDPVRAPNTAVGDFVRSSGAEVWTGANHKEVDRDGHRREFNSAFRVFAGGAVDRRYDKNILVPFGEYVPLRDVVPGFRDIHTAGNFEAGREVPVYDAGPARFVFLVCYEAIRPAFVRKAIGSGANLLVNVTVDAWYGDSSEQSQHLMLAAVQSALNGLPLLRSTTTGISAFVDASGVITASTGTFTREVLVRDVKPLRVASLYSTWGDWFAWACVAASVLLLGVPRLRITPAAAERPA